MAKGANALTTREALRLATRGGAEVLGRDDLGQLTVGKRADFAVYEMSGAQISGVWDAVAALVLCAPVRARETWGEGKAVVLDGRIVSFDLEAALADHARLCVGLRD